jgi:putative transport protein
MPREVTLETLRAMLADSPALLLFAVIGVGIVAGHVRLAGFSLGVAGVLFAGLAVGAWLPEGAAPLQIQADIPRIGLVLFVYAVGLSSGPGFFGAWRQRGLRSSAAVLIALVVSAAVALAVGWSLGLLPAQIAGVFCGGLTNTPALAAVTELAGPAGANDAAVGYSVAYPFGVVGGLVAFDLYLRWHRRAADAERAEAQAQDAQHGRLVSAAFRVVNPEHAGQAIGALRVRQ